MCRQLSRSLAVVMAAVLSACGGLDGGLGGTPLTATLTTTYKLTMIRGGTGTGTIVSNPSGISCTISGTSGSGTCSALYASGTVVTLTATAASGNTFGGWSGPCTGTGSCQVTMSQAQNVTATFLPGYKLTMISGGVGGGTVVSTPAGINCVISGSSGSGTCSAVYASGIVVTLAATPASGSTFAGWSGPCTGTGNCQVTMSQARNVTATFTLPTYKLTLINGGPGSGAITSTPGGISCTLAGGGGSGTCAARYPSGTVVTLTATAASGYAFAGWSGACTGLGACQVTMSQARNVTVRFMVQQIAVPAYFYHTSSEWTRLLAEVPPANVIVINPDNGPGTAVDPGYASRISDAHARGATVYGYVYTKYANTHVNYVRNPNGAKDRTVDSVNADIDLYFSQYPNLDGIFLDEVSDSIQYIASYYRPIYNNLKGAHPGAKMILNPGTSVDAGFLTAGDIIVTWEDTFSSYQNNWSTVNRGWETSANSSRIWHIVHSTSSTDLQAAINLSRQRNAGFVYVTSYTADPGVNTYGQLPSYFHDEATRVKAP